MVVIILKAHGVQSMMVKLSNAHRCKSMIVKTIKNPLMKIYGGHNLKERDATNNLKKEECTIKLKEPGMR